MKKLLDAPKIISDESLPGYILRLSQQNLCETVNWIYSDISIQKKKVIKLEPYSKQLRNLSIMANMPIETLCRSTYLYEFQNIVGQRIYNTCLRWGINNYTDKLCPICLGEKLYHRKIWNISINVVCPLHKVLLINTCKKCNKRISPLRNHLDICSCGFPLKDLPIIKIDDKFLESNKILHECFYNLKITDNDNPLSSLEFGQIIALIISVWFRTSGCTQEKRLDINSDTQDRNFFNSLMEAFEVFSEWPINYYRFLVEIHMGKEGGKNVFGNWYRDLNTKFNIESFEFLHNEFNNYINKYWHKPVNFGSSDIDNDEFISGEQTMHILKIDRRKLYYLIKKKLLIAREVLTSSGYRHLSIKTSSIKDYINESKYYVDPKNAAKILGTTKKNIDKLSNIKLITEVNILNDYGTRNRLFDQRSLKKLISNIEEKSEVINYTEKLEIIDFSLALNYMGINGFNITDLIYFILEDLIKPICNLNSNGFKKFHFIKEELKKVIKIQRLIKFNEGILPLNIKEFSRLIGYSQEVISSWRGKGFLPNKNDFVKEDLLSFLKNYIPLKHIAMMNNSTPNHMLKRLEELGVYPVSGRNIDDSLGYLFLIINLPSNVKLADYKYCNLYISAINELRSNTD